MNPVPVPRMALIAVEVAARHGLEVGDLKGRSRERHICHARFEAFARCYDTGRFSTIRIGQFFNRDHSTVVHGLARYREKVAA